MARNTVLLVDDNKTHSYSLGKHLEESGFDVVQAHTGGETLEVAADKRPDLILLDIHLPDQTGFDVCQKLKADPATQQIPVIFHSATYDTASAQAQAVGLGAVSFLSYPINVEHLVSVVKGAIMYGKKESGRKN